jgi:translation initiation factor 4E
MQTLVKGPAKRLEGPSTAASIQLMNEVTPMKQYMSNEDRSPIVESNVLRVGSTGLWGVWEMWCDFPAKVSQQNRYCGHHATMSEKLAQYQPPTWLDSVKSVGVFDTAEGFWVIHDCVLEPSRLVNGSNYYLFRQNIAPMWEHEANRRGGKWVAQFGCDQGADVDHAWLQACVAMIGEAFPGQEEEICGVCVAKRKSGFKVSLWTRNADDEAAQMAIGKHLGDILRCGQDGNSAAPGSTKPLLQLKYLRHCETLESCSTHVRGASPTNTNSPTNSLGSNLFGQSKVPGTLYSI